MGVSHHSNGTALLVRDGGAVLYFERAASAGSVDAMYELGVLYLNGSNYSNVRQDIGKAIEYFQIAADTNHTNSQFELGLIYLNVKGNKELAEKYLKQAADCEHAAAAYNLGLLYYGNDNRVSAMQYFKKASELGFVDARYHIGKILLIEHDLEQCRSEQCRSAASDAVSNFLAASRMGHSSANYELGMIYKGGTIGIPRNVGLAIKYFSAVSPGSYYYASSQFELGLINLNGGNTSEEALTYFETAAKCGHISATYNLGLLHYENKKYELAMRYLNKASELGSVDAKYFLAHTCGAKKNALCEPEKVLPTYLEKAASMGHKGAMNEFCTIFTDKCKVTELTKFQYTVDIIWFFSHTFLGTSYKGHDCSVALHFCSEAAKQSDANAQWKLGDIYFQGGFVGVEVEAKNLAIDFYNAAAQQQQPDAMYKLAELYAETNMTLSTQYFAQASALGSCDAKYKLGMLHIRDSNIRAAIHYFTESGESGCLYAYYELGLIYLKGLHSIRIDVGTARDFFEKASVAVDPVVAANAQFQLGLIYLNSEWMGIPKNMDRALKYFEEADKLGNINATMQMGRIYAELSSRSSSEEVGHDIEDL